MTKKATKKEQQEATAAEKVASAINGGKPVSTPKAADKNYRKFGRELCADYCKQSNDIDSAFRDRLVRFIKPATKAHLEAAMEGCDEYRKSLHKDVAKIESFRISRMKRVLKAATLDHDKTLKLLAELGINRALKVLPKASTKGRKAKPEVTEAASDDPIAAVRKLDSVNALRALYASIEICKAADAKREAYAVFMGERMAEAFEQFRKEWQSAQVPAPLQKVA